MSFEIFFHYFRQQYDYEHRILLQNQSNLRTSDVSDAEAQRREEDEDDEEEQVSDLADATGDRSMNHHDNGRSPIHFSFNEGEDDFEEEEDEDDEERQVRMIDRISSP